MADPMIDDATAELAPFFVHDDNATDIDLLDFDAVVAPIVAAIKSPSAGPLTVGIRGNWGSGKSTLLRLIRNELVADQRFLVIEVDPWAYESGDRMRAALTEEVLLELRDKATSATDEAKKKIKHLLARVRWGKVATHVLKGTITLPVDGALGVLKKIVKGVVENPDDFVADGDEADSVLPTDMRGFREEFSALVDELRLKRAGEGEMKTWTAEQLLTFLQGVGDHRLGAAFLLAATTGMRRGEVLGLRWADINLKARRLTVNQTVLNVAYKITIGSPKTARSRRTIALDPETVRALQEHRRQQSVERRSMGPAYLDQDLAFAREDGRPTHPDLFSQTFQRTVKRLGLPKIRLHDLRHTHATMGLAAGIPIKIMSTRLGHATTAFTQDIYMHSVPAMEEGAADQIADLIFNQPGSTRTEHDQSPAPTSG